jgi:hypothetical protein
MKGIGKRSSKYQITNNGIILWNYFSIH